MEVALSLKNETDVIPDERVVCPAATVVSGRGISWRSKVLAPRIEGCPANQANIGDGVVTHLDIGDDEMTTHASS